MGRLLSRAILVAFGSSLVLGACTFQATIIDLPPAIDANCGDGIVDPGELCDGNCPTSPDECDEGDPCTNHALVGDPNQCNVECRNIPVTTCGPVDLCCPAGCDGVDADCNPVCGNDVREGNELCDGLDCPDSCPPDPTGPVCDRLILTGSRNNCDAECVVSPQLNCVDNDGCCPTGCDGNADNDCIACGNGIREPGETCELGDCPRPSTCADKASCSQHTLTGVADQCTSICTVDEVTSCGIPDGCCPDGCTSITDPDCSSRCGDGVVQAPELCDGNCPRSDFFDCDDGLSCTADFVVGSAANCSSQCAHAPIVDCDSGDGCCPTGCDAVGDTDCITTCGDGFIQPPETCDGNCINLCPTTQCTTSLPIGGDAVCDVQCLEADITVCLHDDGCCPGNCNANNDNDCPEVCGNGILELGTEECDDYNNIDGDGCSSGCEVETFDGWNCDNDSPSLCTWTCGAPGSQIEFDVPGVYVFQIDCMDTLEVYLVGGGGGGGHAANTAFMPITLYGGGGGGGGASILRDGGPLVAGAGGGGGGAGGLGGAPGGGGGGGAAVRIGGYAPSAFSILRVFVGGGGEPGCLEASGNGGGYAGGFGSDLPAACTVGTLSPGGEGGGGGGVAGCGAGGGSERGGGGGGGGSSILGGGGGGDQLNPPGTSVSGQSGAYDCPSTPPCIFGGPGGGGGGTISVGGGLVDLGIDDGETGDGGLAGGVGGDSGDSNGTGGVNMNPDGNYPGGGGYGGNSGPSCMPGTGAPGAGGDGRVVFTVQ